MKLCRRRGGLQLGKFYDINCKMVLKLVELKCRVLVLIVVPISPYVP